MERLSVARIELYTVDRSLNSLLMTSIGRSISITLLDVKLEGIEICMRPCLLHKANLLHVLSMHD